MLDVFRDFNLLATTPRGREFIAIRSLESILYDLGDENPEIWKSGIGGVILAYINLDPINLIYDLRSYLHENPWQFRDIRRVVPIEYVVDTSLEEFSRVADDMVSRIPEDASYKVEVRRRYTNMNRMDIIDSIARRISRKVDLSNPDYIVNVEVLGPRTGLSLIRKDGVLSVEKELLR